MRETFALHFKPYKPDGLRHSTDMCSFCAGRASIHMEHMDQLSNLYYRKSMDYKKLYKQMLLLRRFEERAGKLYKMGEIAGFCHLYIGQEAIIVGVKAHARDDDVMVTTYRDHGHMIALGMDPKGVLAELTGRIGGFSKGKGGSMHMFSIEKGFMGGHGIVGATVPLGTGMALAKKYINTDAISITFLGDGAMNQGQVYEAFNIASLWSLPVLYIIEDNGYSIGTSKARGCAGGELYKRAEPFGIEGRIADGMDLEEVMETAKWGIDYVRKNQRPAIIQFSTYRFRGHSMSDATKLYRTKEEEEMMMQERDCLNLAQAKYKISDAEVAAFEEEVKRIVDEAEEFALTSPEPGLEELYTDVYIEE